MESNKDDKLVSYDLKKNKIMIIQSICITEYIKYKKLYNYFSYTKILSEIAVYLFGILNIKLNTNILGKIIESNNYVKILSLFGYGLSMFITTRAYINKSVYRYICINYELINEDIVNLLSDLSSNQSVDDGLSFIKSNIRKIDNDAIILLQNICD